MNVLMVGVDKKRLGGMWTVANNYINNQKFNEQVELDYVATSTNGSIVKRLIFMIKGIVKIRRLLKKKTYDVVHIHMAEKGSTYRKGYVAKICKNMGCKVIIQLHAGPFADWYDTLNNHKQNKVKRIFDYADKILVLGEYWKKELARIVPLKKIEVLYNGVEIPGTNFYNSQNKTLVFMGVLKKEKGIYDLIDAIKIIDDKLPNDIKVLFCGNDPDKKINNIISEQGLDNRIKLLGWIDAKEKEKIYKSMKINILPSYFEALSMTVLEAMSYGVPVITTNISTMEEMLENSEQLVPVGEPQKLAQKILEFINDDFKLELISQQEYKKAKKVFSIENNINETLRIYEETVRSENR